jgi:catechol 2,3-dioxygenase-like lactoylglutathione lyase family enzyme
LADARPEPERNEGRIEMAPTLAERIFHIAYVVPNLKAALAFFQDKLDVPRFLVKEDVQLQDQMYMGKPADIRQSIAFGWAGHFEFELIQPLSGTSTYSEFLKKVPGGGMQHTGILVDDYDKGVAEMTAKGFTLVQSGRNGDTRFGYFDTDRVIGTLTEVVYRAPKEEEFIARFRRGEA